MSDMFPKGMWPLLIPHIIFVLCLFGLGLWFLHWLWHLIFPCG